MIYMTLGAETQRKVVHEQAGCSKWRLEPGDHAYLSGFHFGKPWLHRLVVAKGQEISLRRVYVISMISLYVGVDDFSEALVM